MQDHIVQDRDGINLSFMFYFFDIHNNILFLFIFSNDDTILTHSYVCIGKVLVVELPYTINYFIFYTILLSISQIFPDVYSIICS